jgi:hypothetical protein
LRAAGLRADNCSINRHADDAENEQPTRQNWRLLLMQLVNDASRMLQQVFQKTDWVFCVRHWLEDEIVGEQWWLFRWNWWWVHMVFGFGFRQRKRCRKARQTAS